MFLEGIHHISNSLYFKCPVLYARKMPSEIRPLTFMFTFQVAAYRYNFIIDLFEKEVNYEMSMILRQFGYLFVFGVGQPLSLAQMTTLKF